MLSLLTYFVVYSLYGVYTKIDAQFIGNRTFYPNMQQRNGSNQTDPNYDATAKGPIKILTLPSQQPSQSMLNFISGPWQSQNNIQIHQVDSMANQATSDYLTYLVNDLCLQAQPAFDMVWIDETMVGVLENCLWDLYAWDFSFGAGLDPSSLYSGIVRHKYGIANTIS